MLLLVFRIGILVPCQIDWVSIWVLWVSIWFRQSNPWAWRLAFSFENVEGSRHRRVLFCMRQAGLTVSASNLSFTSISVLIQWPSTRGTENYKIVCVYFPALLAARSFLFISNLATPTTHLAQALPFFWSVECYHTATWSDIILARLYTSGITCIIHIHRMFTGERGQIGPSSDQPYVNRFGALAITLCISNRFACRLNSWRCKTTKSQNRCSTVYQHRYKVSSLTCFGDGMRCTDRHMLV